MLSGVILLATLRNVVHQALSPWDSPGKNTGVGCRALLQGIFSHPTPPPREQIQVSCVFCVADGLFTAEPLRKPIDENSSWQIRVYTHLNFMSWFILIISGSNFLSIKLFIPIKSLKIHDIITATTLFSLPPDLSHDVAGSHQQSTTNSFSTSSLFYWNLDCCSSGSLTISSGP